MGSENVRYCYGFSCTAHIADLLKDQFAGRATMLVLIDSGAATHARRLLDLLDADRRTVPILVEAQERQKTLGLINSLLERAVAAGAGRDTVVVAMGGGVVGNMAGMVAALLYRGLPLVHLPTTPVAAFDAVLSAKQAVNLPQGKNLCGAYVVPSLIACDLAWLRTVPAGLMMTGIAEMVKNVLAVLPGDVDRLSHAITRLGTDPEGALRTFLDIGVRAKAPFIKTDPKEKHAAMVFEYGHTVGHAIEFASQGSMSHGAAVGWGMLAAATVAREICGLPADAERCHREMLAALGLSRRRLSAIDPLEVKQLLSTDNKRGYLTAGSETVAMVLLESLGRPVVSDGRPLIGVPRPLVESAIDELYAYGPAR